MTTPTPLLDLSGPLHDTGMRAKLPSSLARALAWDVAATLMEQHDDLVVLELHPGGGQYDCLSVYERPGRLVAHLNITGSLTHASWFEHSGERITWYEVLANGASWAASLLEGAADLLPPAKKPTPEARTARACAKLAEHLALRPDVEILSAVADSSYGCGVRRELVDPYQAVIGRRLSLDTSVAGKGAYRWWFVGLVHPEGHTPVACLDAATAQIWLDPTSPPRKLATLTHSELASSLLNRLGG